MQTDEITLEELSAYYNAAIGVVAIHHKIRIIALWSAQDPAGHCQSSLESFHSMLSRRRPDSAAGPSESSSS